MEGFNQPFFAPAIGAAHRGFVDEINRPESPMFGHPEDYDLYLIGVFDQDTGQFTMDGPKMICEGKIVKRPGPGVSGA